ncbi:TonB-dependent receptor [Mucilaginibacter sp. JRF]|uniref:TonB-dependent receptor n=1 Tax=Mucilaginibacter sp. JRF TaxID=2780088 RepID=UPI00187F771C|nr:TonB-dependent receptor [Mucilaginibacter sp. JRF]MBE9586197.1 TonB-dependent receptor [Mucilaginibacter sp. JRF]
MKNIYILLVLTISIFAPASAQTKTELRGSVSDDMGEPLAGATVQLEPDRHLTQADNKGNFVFKNIYPGNYNITISMVGYQTYQDKISLNPGSKTPLNIKLSKGQSELSEVNVSGKNITPDNLIDVQRSAMPVTVISRRTIELMGSRRLDEVLKEQTGVAIVNDIGSGSRATGVQMQGFSSQYVMVLVDGQPMIGRNNGNLDLSRISVNNVERIELIKGATSCLYGSEALGGAINIITKHGAVQQQARAALFYGSRNLIDGTLEAETPFNGQRGSALLSANYYGTDGYNTNKTYLRNSQTIPPFQNYSGQAHIKYQLGTGSYIGLQARYNKRSSQMEQTFVSSDISNTNSNVLNDEDLSLTANYKKIFKNGLRSLTNYYFTNYTTNMQVKRVGTNEVLAGNAYKETTHRIEEQFAYQINTGLNFTGGIGGSRQNMDDFAGNTIYNGYAYLQGDVIINPKWSAVGGIRYDHTNNYGGRLNPSLGLQYHVSPALSFKAGLGTGFIAPDLRKRFQVFTNITQGYTVLGADILRDALQELQNTGEVSEIRESVLNQLPATLRPERSTSYNAGLVLTPSTKIKVEASIFYHSLRDFINFIQIGTKTNGQQIFTYQNLANAVNKGFEVSASASVIKNLNANFGYQYLITKDKRVEDQIRRGQYPYNKIRNNNTGETSASVTGDYIGLENRSRHMVNANFTYQAPANITLTLRANYRGKYGWGDDNNNLFLDRYDIFVRGFVLVYSSVEKRLMNSRLSLILSGENLFDYTDPLMPGQIGRTLTAGLTWRFYKD